MSLITLIVVIVVVALVIYIIRILPIEQPFKNVAVCLVVLVLILWLLSSVGMFRGLNFG